MDFQISENIQQRAREARKWVEDVLDPLSVDLEKKEIFPPELYEELKRGKFFGITIPKEYGGEGLAMTDWYPLLEEYARGYAFVRMMAHCMNGLMWRAIYFFGKEHHKQELLPKMARGEIMVANCLTEPEAGTGKDINTRAKKVGDKWIINGHKWLITVFPDLVSCFYITFANTENGVTCFGVRDNNPGIHLVPMEKIFSETAKWTNRTFLASLETAFVSHSICWHSAGFPLRPVAWEWPRNCSICVYRTQKNATHSEKPLPSVRRFNGAWQKWPQPSMPAGDFIKRRPGCMNKKNPLIWRHPWPNFSQRKWWSR